MMSIDTQRLAAGAAFLVSLLLSESLGAEETQQRAEDTATSDPPNVVLILADDVGYGDLGCYGATAVQTPHIDRLAREGMQFTDAHAAASTCTPSRYGLLTGRYPFRDPRATMPVDPLEPLILDTQRYTLGRLFQDAGYVTGCVGKWHLGFGVGRPDWNGELKPGPLEVGFDECFCVPYTNDRVPCVYVRNHRVVGLDPADPIQITHYGSDRSRRFSQLAGHRRIGHMQGGKAALWKDVEIGEVLTEQAVGFLENNRDRPFFLYFPTVAIHIPLTPHPRFRGTSQCGVYGDFIHELDGSVGRVMETLERLNLTDNTLVIFTSDNGATGGPRRDKHLTNGVLRGHKFGIYEGGHRVPFVARWPGHIPAGSQCDDLVGLSDVLATSAALLGRPLPEGADLDSVSILPSLLAQAKSPPRSTWMVHAGKRRQISIRDGNWKLIFPNPWNNMPRISKDANSPAITDELVQQCELYNLAQDLREERDLANHHPEMVSRLLSEGIRQMERDYEPDAKPDHVDTSRSLRRDQKQQNVVNKDNPVEINRVQFDFESRDLQGWHLVSGQPPAAVRGEADSHYLSTRAAGSLGPGDMTISAQGIRAVMESPVFRVTGATATFDLGGFADGKAAYLSLYDLDGRELRRASPAGRRGDAGKLKPMTWDVADLAGKSVYLRLIDRAGPRSGGYIEFDDFQVAGQPDREATFARRKHHDAVRESALAPARQRLAEIRKLVFAVREPGKNGHWYANFGHWSTRPDYKMYGKGGRLCVVNTCTKTVETLLDDREGAVRDPQVHYDARKILFSYRPGGTEYFHLYEIDVDGNNLRQLTDGLYDDIEPSYLPDDRIVFCSSRCKRWVPCHWVEVATLHTCNADGSNIRAISANVEHENTPWPMPDGRVLYTRWEYIDRGVTQFHHLWTTNPDGTGQMVYFGNMQPGGLFIDAKPTGHGRSVVFVNSPGHGRLEHAGTICTVDPQAGPNARQRIREISHSDNFRDPYPLEDVGLVAAQNTRLVLMSPDGHAETIHQLTASDGEAGLMCHEPRPITTRPREPQLVDQTDRCATTGRLMLSDIYESRNLAGVKRGQIRKLLVLEVLPKSLNASYGPEPISVGGAHNLERVLGTVPVEPDGSAYLEVPAMRPLFFVALDKENRAVKRMHSFLTVQPGETVGCVGCHEHRQNTPLVQLGALDAMQTRVRQIAAIPGVPEIIDFPRDVQPILDRHCVGCHDYDATERGGPRAGGVVLSGDRGPAYTHSYASLHSVPQLVKVAGGGLGNTPPYSNGSGASRLTDLIDGSHYDATLSSREQRLIRLWLDVGAPFTGTNAAEDSGMFRRFIERLIRNDQKTEFGPRLPAAIPSIAGVYASRCNTCHRGQMGLAVDPADNQDGREWNLGPGGKRRKFTRHFVFNLSRPERSTLLLAPLAREAGGYGICSSKNQGATASVFADSTDPDYQQLLSVIRESRAMLEQMTRFDMPDFIPSEHYVREMKRYGFIPREWKPGDPIDVYAVDQAYWESFYPK